MHYMEHLIIKTSNNKWNNISNEIAHINIMDYAEWIIQYSTLFSLYLIIIKENPNEFPYQKETLAAL